MIIYILSAFTLLATLMAEAQIPRPARFPLPTRYIELVKYIQPAPDQAETNTCYFMASTGAVEILLNRKHNIRNAVRNGPFDLSESFLVWQRDYQNLEKPTESWIEEMVQRFNHGEAIRNSVWPYSATNADGTSNWEVWEKHVDFDDLPRLKIPKIESETLFARGGSGHDQRWSTKVLDEDDIYAVKEALVKFNAPVIVNYVTDETFWHVVLIVGYEDTFKGECFEMVPADCKKTGAFYVRDSDGRPYSMRSYEWFLERGNTAAVVKLKNPLLINQAQELGP